MIVSIWDSFAGVKGQGLETRCVELLSSLSNVGSWRFRDRLLLDGATDVDDVVSDDAEADPAVHSDVALVAATTEAVSALGRRTPHQ